VGNAAFAKVSRRDGDPSDPWQVVLGAWNEQHCYPVAKDFTDPLENWWYMGDIGPQNRCNRAQAGTAG
jgi:hypothetical protein